MRPATLGDDAFLRALYRSTREPEIASLQWTEAQKAAFCEMQFRAQSSGYRNTYPEAEHWIVCSPDGEPAGRLIKADAGAALQLVDIALLPAFRAQGWGTMLIRSLQDEAAAQRKPLRLSVEKSNPALALYRRLGFVACGERDFRCEMTWRPEE